MQFVLSFFPSFQELDLSAETLLKNVTPREDEWLKISEKGLPHKAKYTKVTRNASYFPINILFCFWFDFGDKKLTKHSLQAGDFFYTALYKKECINIHQNMSMLCKSSNVEVFLTRVLLCIQAFFKGAIKK